LFFIAGGKGGVPQSEPKLLERFIVIFLLTFKEQGGYYNDKLVG
jgi:hypothetical protein